MGFIADCFQSPLDKFTSSLEEVERHPTTPIALAQLHIFGKGKLFTIELPEKPGERIMGERYLKILMGTPKCCFQLEKFFFFKEIVEG